MVGSRSHDLYIYYNEGWQICNNVSHVCNNVDLNKDFNLIDINTEDVLNKTKE